MSQYHGLLMASGGMDSTVMAYWLKSQGKNILPLFFDYGQHCMENELETLKSVLPKEYKENLRIINIKDIYSGTNSASVVEPDLWKDDIVADDLYLPFRNMLFFSIAFTIAEINNIKYVYSAFIDSNLAKEVDCSSEFFNRLEHLLRLYKTVNIELPFKDYSKKDVAQLGLKLNAPIMETFSCQANSKVHCGACPNCVDRLRALESI
ncbi:7-cyano-7-deazaguanine synthase [Caldifermentibacillus hisashii]|uniref:7-cyano-7-deazaguanine synthase n=1 Tax=Caldifermentibacillus hisashii TaxID=996558 RepID=UPI00310151FC